MSKLSWNKQIELWLKELYVYIDPDTAYLLRFAETYGIKNYDQVEGTVLENVMPGVMNPGETAPVALVWLFGYNNDKIFRVQEAIRAAKTFEAIIEDSEMAEKQFLDLKVHGRVMIIKIAELHKLSDPEAYDKVINFVTLIMGENINLNEIPFDKNGLKVSDILNIFVKPILEDYNSEEYEPSEEDIVNNGEGSSSMHFDPTELQNNNSESDAHLVGRDYHSQDNDYCTIS